MDTVTDQIGTLLTRLQSSDYYQREEAVTRLSNLAQDEAVAGLVLALEDPDLGIRELAADYLCDLKGRVASRLLIKCLEHEDIGTRNLAAEILVKIGRDAVVPLLDETRNPDQDVRKFVTDVLGLIGDERAVEALCECLWDENPNVAGSAAEALGAIGSEQAVTALLSALETVPDARLQIIEALGKIGRAEVLPALYAAAETDDTTVKYAAIEAIGLIGQAASVPQLARYLRQDQRSVAEAALTAIVDVANANEGRLYYDLRLEAFADFLIDGFRQGNKKVSDFALKHLPQFEYTDVIESLLEVLGDVEEPIRARIVDIIGEWGPATLDYVLTFLPEASSETKLILLDVVRMFVNDEVALRILDYADDDDARVRQKVAHLLGISGNGEVLPTLRRLACDDIGHVRSAAYTALGWLASEPETEFLISGLDDAFPDVRDAALGALIIGGSPLAVQKFTQDLYHEDTERQCLAVKALGIIGDADVVGALAKALNHPEAIVRKLAIESLARIGGLTDLQPVTLALTDESPEVRKAAVSALLAMRGQQAVADIRVLLEDNDLWVRYHTIGALGELNVETYAEWIMPFLEDSHDILQIAATKALASMGCRKAAPQLRALLDHGNPDVAEAARSAVAHLEVRP